MPYTQIATDNFTRANGALGANWSTQSGTWAISSDQAEGSAAGNNVARWVGSGSFTNSQYAIATVGPSDIPSNAGYEGCALQCDGTHWYDLACNYVSPTLGWIIRKNGSNLATGTVSGIIVDGDTFELDFIASTGVLNVYHNGTLIGTTTDGSPLSGGVPGLFAYAATQIYYSNWVGGNIVSSTGIPGALALTGCGAS